MGIAKSLQAIRNLATLPPPAIKPALDPSYISMSGGATTSGKRVTPEISKTLASAYRCGNIISDDIASIPLQEFVKNGRNIQRVDPDFRLRNAAYLFEISPNRWMTPFIFKKTVILWLLYWGNAYIWNPLGSYQESFILPANLTHPVYDAEGNIWYETYFPNGKKETIPDVEITSLIINSTNGINGRSVIEYARETIGRQLGQHETQDRISGKGLNPTAAITMNGELKGEEGEAARKKVKTSYLDAISGSDNAGGVAVFDNKVAKFEAVTMKPVDAQFLETMQFTDLEIANFFGLPLWKLNQGKQSYESNAQQQLDYLATTLNPYLVQWEQAARLKMLRQEDQIHTYFKFNRESLLQTDPKARAEYKEIMIRTGQMTPNEGREIDDISPYKGGDGHYLEANMASIGEDGKLISATGIINPAKTGGK